MTDPLEPDILIIGGGPAGSTAAAFLAMRGRQVTLLEKEAHPRFHIGESLLPRNLDIFERLGVLDQVRGIGVHKPGAEFVSDRTGRSCPFPFAQALNQSRVFSNRCRSWCSVKPISPMPAAIAPWHIDSIGTSQSGEKLECM